MLRGFTSRGGRRGLGPTPFVCVGRVGERGVDMETTERVRLLVAPLAQDLGLEIYDIEYSGGVVRVTVDRPGGVDIGQIGTLTRALSRALDEEDPLPGEYTLEVSSPGLER